MKYKLKITYLLINCIILFPALMHAKDIKVCNRISLLCTDYSNPPADAFSMCNTDSDCSDECFIGGFGTESVFTSDFCGPCSVSICANRQLGEPCDNGRPSVAQEACSLGSNDSVGACGLLCFTE